MAKAAQAQLALAMRNVSKTFGGVKALSSVSFEVRAGEVHCLAGENGSGKSTLIKIATGVYQADPGAELSVFGEDIASPTPAQSRRLGLEVIWQDLALFAELSVAENIAIESILGAVPRWVRRRSMIATAERVLSRLGVDLDVDVLVKDLPIAQRQIVAIARALVGDAKLIFMDEPTSSLTQSETDYLLEVVRTLSADGVAVVFVSHRLAEVLDVSSSVTVLRDGKLVGVYPTSDMSQARLTELMTGQTFDTEVAARDCLSAEPILEVRGLSRTGEYRNLDLTIHKGEIVGVTGLIGAGRTELGLSLFGLTRPDRGEIRIEGKPVHFRSNSDAIRAGVAYVPEDRLSLGLVQPQSIADNLSITVLNRILSNCLISYTKKDGLVEKWIDDLAIKIGLAADAVSTLSGGNQQRVVLGKWLATEPTLLILDAPTVGVDVGARAGIFAIVRRLAEAGLAILLISDEVQEVFFNADRILHMANGTFVSEHDPRKSTLAELEAEVYG